MQVIPKNLNITNGSHVFETPDEIIINSQMYDKVTMKPKPFQFWNYDTFDYKSLLLNNVNLFENPWSHIVKEEGYQYYMQDNIDPDIFYFIHEAPGNNTVKYLSKVRKIENTYEVLATDYYWSGRSTYTFFYNYHNYKFLAQTDDYIILWQQGEGDGGGGGAGWRRKSGEFVRVKKSDLSADYIYIGGAIEMLIQPIKMIDGNLWLFLNWSGDPHIVLYVIETNEIKWIWNEGSGEYSDAYCPGLSNMVQFNGAYYIFSNNANHTGYAFRSISIDFEKETVSSRLITCFSHSDFPFHEWGKIIASYGWLIFTLKNIDDQYIAVTGHSDENAIIVHNNLGHTQGQTVFADSGWHKHIVYEYVSKYSRFEPRDVINFGNSTLLLYGVMYYDQYTPVFLSASSIMFYRFNLTTKVYEKCFELPGTFYTMGFDEYKRFYACDDMDKVHLYTEVTAVNLSATFDKDTYEYTGTPVDGTITISSYNFIRQRIAVDVRVVLTGPCVFPDGTKEKIITTSNLDDTIEQIQIMDNGKISVHVSQISTTGGE